MLYERWREVAEAHARELALIDSGTGQRWTFAQLAAAAERETGAHPSVAFPVGLSGDFVLAVLRAWRRGAVVCPLELGQAPVALSELPAGCVHLKTTSASTGPARLIAFSADQLVADANQIVATMGLRPEWPNLAVISLAHSYGFSNLVLPLLLHGVPLVLATSPLPESVRRAAQLVPAVTLPAVPALWRAWVDADAIPSNLQLAISAGAPLPLALEQKAFAACGVKIHNFYGASECGGIAYDPGLTPRTDDRSVGRALQNVQLSVNDEGCLAVRSPAVGLTYWPEPSRALRQKRYQTSDLARLEKGQVLLVGRQTDQINVAGRKVSPESIEQVLSGHPAVRHCLVFGAPSADSDRSEMIVACVATVPETSTDLLKQHLLMHLPAWQIPRDWWVVADLETNPRGKLARAAWRQRYLSGPKDS